MDSHKKAEALASQEATKINRINNRNERDEAIYEALLQVRRDTLQEGLEVAKEIYNTDQHAKETVIRLTSLIENQ